MANLSVIPAIKSATNLSFCSVLSNSLLIYFLVLFINYLNKSLVIILPLSVLTNTFLLLYILYLRKSLT